MSNSLRLSILGWAKTLANQVAAEGILINNVCPGWTRTDRVVEIFEARAKGQGTTPEKVEAGITRGIPMGRLGKPEELANLVVFLGLKWRVTLPVFPSRLMAGRYKGSINKTLLRGKQ